MAKALASSDPVQVAGAMRALFFHVLNEKSFSPSDALFGLTPSRAADLYQQTLEMAEGNDRLRDISRGIRNLSTAELSAIAHIDGVRAILNTGAHVMAERNAKNSRLDSALFERQKRRENLVQNIQTMKDLGMGKEEIAWLFSNIKYWPTFTPHPTKDKNREGGELTAENTALADHVLPEEREESLAKNARRMLSQRLTPSKKDTLPEETIDGLHSESVYLQGMLDYFEDLQYSFDRVLGPGAIDLTDPRMHIDLAPRDWHAGDADGKYVPAPALFTKRLRGAYMAVEKNIEMLSDARIPQAGREKLEEVLKAFTAFRENLAPLHDNILNLRDLKSDSDAFNKAKHDFSAAFTDVSYKGETYSEGPLLTLKIMEDLRQIAHDLANDEATRMMARRVVMRHKQVGMAMGRQEIRHNGADYEQIFNNLYSHLKKHRPDILPQGVESLEALNPEAQASFLKTLMRDHGPHIKKWLMDSNPEGWNREILERFEVMRHCFNHNRMGVGIISEARAISPVQQQVLAEAFGIENMVHEALNEDRETLEKAAENLTIYSKVFGKKNIQARQNANGSNPELSGYLCIMDPRSDSQKQNGIGIHSAQRNTKLALARMAIKFGAPIYDKIGTGMSPVRGGMSPQAVPRILINVLSELEEFNEQELSPDDLAILKKMASHVSTTIQGRDAGIRMATPEQAYDMISGVLEEMCAACLAIDGKIPLDISGPKAARYSGAMRNALDRIEREACEEYAEMRKRQSLKSETLGQNRMDMYLQGTSALIMAEKAGVGARRDARKDLVRSGNKVEKKPVSGLRAIGTTMAIENNETRFDGSYTLGSIILRKLYLAYQEGTIKKSDLRTFWNDPFYMEQTYPNAFVTLAAGDYEHGFDKLRSGEHPWRTLGALMEAIKAGYKDMGDNEVFHADLTMDAIRATAYMEALANTVLGGGTGFDKSEEEIIGAVYKKTDRLNKLKFGPRTRRKFPDIKEVQENTAANLLSRAIKHEMERRIDSGEIGISSPEDNSILHHIACADRTHGPLNMGILMDRTGFGSRKGMVSPFALIRQHMLRHAPRAESRPEIAEAELAVAEV